MDLISAIRSGKPFKRKNHETWKPYAGQVVFSKQDVLATDWEIQEEKIERTAEQIRKAVRSALYDASCARRNSRPSLPEEEFVIKELGFKE